MDSYIADLRATIQLELDLKLFRMYRLGIPQDRIAKRLGAVRETIRNHLAKMPESALWPKADLSKGFTVSQMAQKHDWNESMVWSLALEGKKDLERFKQLNWGLRAWDQWDLIQSPLSSERFHPCVVSAMQKKRILGVTSRYVVILEKD